MMQAWKRERCSLCQKKGLSVKRRWYHSHNTAVLSVRDIKMLSCHATHTYTHRHTQTHTDTHITHTHTHTHKHKEQNGHSKATCENNIVTSYTPPQQQQKIIYLHTKDAFIDDRTESDKPLRTIGHAVPVKCAAQRQPRPRPPS